MPGVSKIISKELLERVEIELSKSVKQGDVSRKLQAIKSAKKYGITAVSNIFEVSRVSIFKWIKNFSDNGIDGLKVRPGRGRKYILNEDERTIIKGWIELDCNITIKALQIKIKDNFDKTLKKSAIHNMIKKLNFSYITPRPSHYKQDKTQVDEFKKNLKALTLENSNLPIYFFDESRFGTHSKLGYGWFKTGERTEVKVKLGFKNFYLYGAVNVHTGKDFTLISPHVNTDCMNIWLQQFNRFLNGEEAILIMDGAGWHKSKDLIIPSNLKIVFLPPYSPQLNPVERLWKFIKDNTIKNKIFSTVESLTEEISEFICNLKAETVASICHLDYL
jgi:transposase